MRISFQANQKSNDSYTFLNSIIPWLYLAAHTCIESGKTFFLVMPIYPVLSAEHHHCHCHTTGHGGIDIFCFKRSVAKGLATLYNAPFQKQFSFMSFSKRTTFWAQVGSSSGTEASRGIIIFLKGCFTGKLIWINRLEFCSNSRWIMMYMCGMPGSDLCRLLKWNSSY